jgi:hypothetical protein
MMEWQIVSSSEGNHIAAGLALYQSCLWLQCPFVLFADTLLDYPLVVLGQDFTSVVSSAGQFFRVTVVANPHTRCSQSSCYNQYRDQSEHLVQGRDTLYSLEAVTLMTDGC